MLPLNPVSSPISGGNCQITAAYEAAAAARPAQYLVFALHEDQTAQSYARRIAATRRRSQQRRHSFARRCARKYVPRGGDAFEAMTGLLLRMADAYRDGRAGDDGAILVRKRVDISLLGAVAYAYTVDAPAQQRQRRAKESHLERMQEAAQIIVAWGADRCMNPDCGDWAGSGFYCPACEEDQAVQAKHNRRLKAIGALWDAATPYLLRSLRTPALPPALRTSYPWPWWVRESARRGESFLPTACGPEAELDFEALGATSAGLDAEPYAPLTDAVPCP